MSSNNPNFRTQKRRVSSESQLAWGSEMDWSSEIVESTGVDITSGRIVPGDQSAVSDGLVAYRPYMSSLQDNIGSADGSFQNGTATFSEVDGRTGVFMSDDEHISMPETVSLTSGQPFTYSLQYHQTTAHSSARAPIVDFYDGGGFLFWTTGDAALEYIISRTGQRAILDGTNGIGEWNHIVMTSDGTNARFVFNGVETTGIDYPSPPPGEALIVGQRNPSSAKFYDAYFREERWYDRELSNSEIDTLAGV